MEKLRENKNVLNDGIGYIEQYDPGLSNRTHEDRLLTVTTIASVCYNKPDIIGKQSLYDRLSVEGAGIPSSSFSFIPVLLTNEQVNYIAEMCINRGDFNVPDVITFGELVFSTIESKDETRLLTNLRALLQDLGWQVDGKKAQELSEQFFNTSETDIQMIREHYKVYKVNIDISTSKQWIRHNFHLQELSRRYVSGNKLPFQFYVSEKMKDIYSNSSILDKYGSPVDIEVSTQDVIDIALNHYNKALEQGVAPQEARRIIPQCAYTIIWTGITPRVLGNMLKIRTKAGAQWEFRQLALQVEAWENQEKGDK